MHAQIGIVCGSGIALEEMLDKRTGEVAFEAIPGLAGAGLLAGHERKFVFGNCGGHSLVVQCGRFHFYEGLDYAAVTRPVDFMRSLGVRTVIFTCAVGGLRPGMEPGGLVAIERVRMWPYRAWAGAPEMAVTDFTIAGCDFVGTYQWMHGPCYETRAEIEALQRLQADVVGMSSAPELLRCRELGMRGGIVACVTNSCLRREVLSHNRVVEASARASSRLATILRRSLPGVV